MSFFLFFDENVLRHSYAVFSPRGRKEKKRKERKGFLQVKISKNIFLQ